MSAIGKQSQHKDNLAFLEKQKIENMNSKFRVESRLNFIKNIPDAKSQDKKSTNVNLSKGSDSKLSNFVRGFRREATDFSLLSKRHSAALPESLSSMSVSPQKFQRSSAIFQRNKQKGEPILTDYSKCSNILGKRDDIELRSNLSSNPDFHRIRREKTESVISIVRNQDTSNQQQVIKDKRNDQALVRIDKFPNHYLYYLGINPVCVNKNA
jgi:hypothetical protein